MVSDGDYTSKNKLKFSRHRLPWPDIHSRIDGPLFENISNHFTYRWNYAVSFESKNKPITPHKRNFKIYFFLNFIKFFWW